MGLRPRSTLPGGDARTAHCGRRQAEAHPRKDERASRGRRLPCCCAVLNGARPLKMAGHSWPAWEMLQQVQQGLLTGTALEKTRLPSTTASGGDTGVPQECVDGWLAATECDIELHGVGRAAPLEDVFAEGAAGLLVEDAALLE